MAANVGVCLNVVGNPSASYTVAGEAFGTELCDWDQFYVFDADNWNLTSYTYQGSEDGWYIEYADTDADPETVASLSIAPGTSLYYLGANESFKIAGEVAASGSKTLTFDTEEATAFNFVNPYPVATTFADLETFASDWDQFYVFDAANWNLTSYTYQGSEDGWYVEYADTEVAPETITDSTQVFLPAGQGATYLPGATTSWTKTLNY